MSPIFLGANFTSVTEVRESTRLHLFTQCVLSDVEDGASCSLAEVPGGALELTDPAPAPPVPGTDDSSPGISSHMAAVRSNEQVANT